jgi:hypothetical protein
LPACCSAATDICRNNCVAPAADWQHAGEEVKAEASIPAIYASSDGGSNCGNSSGGAAGADRVPMVAFLDLPEEEQKRLRAGNINDSVLIMRNKRATSGSGAAASGAAKGGDAAVAYYQQQLAQLRSSSDGGSGEGGAEGAVRMPGELHGRSSDGSESGKRVQFGAAEVVAVCSTPGLSSAAGCASAAGVVLEAGAAPAAEAAPVPGCVPPVGAGAAADALLPGGVDGESISIDTSELAAGQRHSRGDDTARISEAPLPGSAS